MKILLAAINAKYIHSNPAVYDLKACAGEAEAFVEIAEYTINQPMEEIRQDLFLREANVICFSCYIWNISLVRQLIRDLKQVCRRVDFWVGGPEVSFNPTQLLRELPIRGVMTGPGEGSFRKLARWYLEGRSEELPQILQEAPVPLSEIPFWYDNLDQFENRIIYYESSRGCPFSCCYCLSSIDKKLDFRSPEQVKKELTFFLERKVPQVKFVDRTFNCKKSHAMEIWQFLLENDNGITNFHFEAAADLLDEDMLALLAKMRPGLVQLEIGVQSTNPKTIEAIHRIMDFSRVSKAVKEIQSRHNIHLHLDLIAGLPWEDYESFGHSFDDVYRLEPEQLQLGFLKVLKGSPMEQAAKEYEIRYTSEPPYEVLETRWLSYDQILRLKRIEAVLELYGNSGQYRNTIKEMEKYYDSPFRMFEQLADWFTERGYFGLQSSRVVRYEQLLSFLLFLDPEKEERWKELLTYDLYLRENRKNRPDFAAAEGNTRQIISDWLAEAAAGNHTPEGYEGKSYRELTKFLHGEVFYRIWDRPRLVIFDYQHRDPLNREAKTIDSSVEIVYNG